MTSQRESREGDRIGKWFTIMIYRNWEASFDSNFRTRPQWDALTKIACMVSGFISGSLSPEANLADEHNHFSLSPYFKKKNKYKV